MDASKFTRRSQEAVGAAIESATAAGNPAVEPAHLLAALLAQPDGIAGPLLSAAGVDVPAVTSANTDALRRLPAATGSSVASPSYARETIAALEAAGAPGDVSG